LDDSSNEDGHANANANVGTRSKDLTLTQSRKPKNYDWKKVEKLMHHKFKQFHYTEGLLYGL
jgi:hypothetical protein